MITKGNLDVITEELSSHPHCPHGPTILFSRAIKGEKRNFFACAAYRERKHCSFFVWENERSKLKKNIWEQERKKFLNNINHRKKFLILNKVSSLPIDKRVYCNTCSEFILEILGEKHLHHNLLHKISDHQINHPSEMLPPLGDAKKEAQYLFSKSSVETLVNIFRQQNYKKIICIGTPRIHEHVRWICNDVNSILLDIDSRFHNFFGPLEYCWYNLFNHHFFFNEAKAVFEDFLKIKNEEKVALILDPPFGGRVEPIAFTLTAINKQYKRFVKTERDLSMFWIFPYFNEPQILNSLPNFKMLDYKVDYDNHPLFQSGPNGRKQGSPVRIFTNVDPGLIKLPKDGYKYCKPCNRWVSKENNHCKICSSCTSKDGRTYVHCSLCNKCVKPTWKHCGTCERCAQIDHKCVIIEFSKDCFYCKKPGHKKSECPQLNQLQSNKRKRYKKDKPQKRRKQIIFNNS